jgi:2,3-bisphosphoglycerate-independent phosphoglycerate mutase
MGKEKKKPPFVLAILDGWGMGPENKKTNAIFAAETPFFDGIMKDFPSTTLLASGHDVGLEKGQMSGSETGHMNIGAGRIVKQDVRIILEAIDNSSFFHNGAILGAIEHAKRNNSNVHLVGLLGNSDSPHSHPDILFALMIMLKKNGLDSRVFLHLFTDGRDSYPRSALEHWRSLKNQLEYENLATLASVSGRFYGMDRTKKWDRLVRAYDAMVEGEGEKFRSFEEIVDHNYDKNLTDEYIEPAVIVDENGDAVGKIKDNDSVIFFNFRSDRARQMSKLFVGTNTQIEKGFPQMNFLKNLAFVAMTEFGPDLNIRTAFDSPQLVGTLPMALSNLRQLYISETEKYAHVTYFINGGYADSVSGEERILVDSPEVRSYKDAPKMAAEEITKIVLEKLESDSYDFICINFPNADMVGHTGDFDATKKGIEEIDKQLRRIDELLKEKSGILVVTADHGNADVLFNEELQLPYTFHSKCEVPFVIVSHNENFKDIKLEERGRLGNVAPTILEILEIKKPEEMTLPSLLKS